MVVHRMEIVETACSGYVQAKKLAVYLFESLILDCCKCSHCYWEDVPQHFQDTALDIGPAELPPSLHYI